MMGAEASGQAAKAQNLSRPAGRSPEQPTREPFFVSDVNMAKILFALAARMRSGQGYRRFHGDLCLIYPRNPCRRRHHGRVRSTPVGFGASCGGGGCPAFVLRVSGWPGGRLSRSRLCGDCGRFRASIRALLGRRLFARGVSYNERTSVDLSLTSARDAQTRRQYKSLIVRNQAEPARGCGGS
jgi:hypothetical protein